MHDIEEQSAEFKMALKHDPVTDDLRGMAALYAIEADEAIADVLDGHDTADAGSWVAERLGRTE